MEGKERKGKERKEGKTRREDKKGRREGKAVHYMNRARKEERRGKEGEPTQR
jgi:hypothetical protein